MVWIDLYLPTSRFGVCRLQLGTNAMLPATYVYEYESGEIRRVIDLGFNRTETLEIANRYIEVRLARVQRTLRGWHLVSQAVEMSVSPAGSLRLWCVVLWLLCVTAARPLRGVPGPRLHQRHARGADRAHG